MEVFLLAVGSVLLLTIINILGVTLGKNTQNLLTVAKLAGLVLIVVVGFGWGNLRIPNNLADSWCDFGRLIGLAAGGGPFHGHVYGSSCGGHQGQRRLVSATAMIFALWTYSGWHEAAYIVSEVKNSRRNIPFALILGTSAVTVIYLAVNAAFLFALGFERARQPAVPAAVLSLAWGEYGSRAISILIMVSALGAINGMVFTTARIYSEFGHDHRFFQPISKWNRRTGTPVRALVTQAGLTLALLVGVSIWVSLDPDLNISTGFEKMVEVTAAVFWLFFLLTGISLFVLRAKDPALPRPFRVPGYPVVPVLFCLSSAYMVYGAIQYKPWESLVGLGILVAGVVFYFLPKKIKRQRVPAPPPPQPAGVL